VRDLLGDYERLSAGAVVGRAVVTGTWGSSPRQPGAALLATPDGRMAGSVSGGCVEAAVVVAISEAIRSRASRLMTFHVTHERAWEVGLACGGSIEVLVEPMVRPDVLEAARGPGGVVVPTVIGGTALMGAPGPLLVESLKSPSREALAALASGVVTVPSDSGDVRVFLEVFPKQPTLLIIGAVHVAEMLVRLARPLGYRTVVADGRSGFLTRERFPDADRLICAWPEEAFREVGVDDATCVCILSHDPKFDEPALELALRSPAAYVGAIGSRQTQALRRERLGQAGFSAAEVARLHGPIGLDLGGREPAEIALAILAEITAVRHGVPGGVRR
jgi:xanthine dehydrogenase accessory factor